MSRGFLATVGQVNGRPVHSYRPASATDLLSEQVGRSEKGIISADTPGDALEVLYAAQDYASSLETKTWPNDKDQ